jgi:hypothetical protein
MFDNKLIALASTFALIGCTDSDPMQGPDQPDNDTTAPAVASTQPATDATGIAANEKIIITFSEPMDPATVEAAYASSDLPADAVTFEWTTDQKVLAITPKQSLVYAEGVGDDPSTVAARTYTLAIGTDAADLAGNTLESAHTLTFATKRRMTTALDLDTSMTRVMLGASLLGSSNDIWIGDNAVNVPYRAFITFDLSPLPADITIESAQFSARQLAPVGSPYNLGPVQANHVTFPTLNGLGSLQAMSIPGTYSTNAASESKSIDVTSQLVDDIAHRATRSDRSQYRLQIDLATNNDGVADRAVFALGTFQMGVIYIAD